MWIAIIIIANQINQNFTPFVYFFVLQIVDMPPGTGDIQITMSQSVALTGAVIVTTPHQLALIDCAKGIAMYDEVRVPTLAVVSAKKMQMFIYIFPNKIVLFFFNYFFLSLYPTVKLS